FGMGFCRLFRPKFRRLKHTQEFFPVCAVRIQIGLVIRRAKLRAYKNLADKAIETDGLRDFRPNRFKLSAQNDSIAHRNIDSASSIRTLVINLKGVWPSLLFFGLRILDCIVEYAADVLKGIALAIDVE